MPLNTISVAEAVMGQQLESAGLLLLCLVLVFAVCVVGLHLWLEPRRG